MPSLAIMGWGLLAVSLAITGAYWYGDYKGNADCDARHEAAQQKQNEKIRGKYDKIDRATPFTGSDDDIANFLLKHTRQ